MSPPPCHLPSHRDDTSHEIHPSNKGFSSGHVPADYMPIRDSGQPDRLAVQLHTIQIYDVVDLINQKHR